MTSGRPPYRIIALAMSLLLAYPIARLSLILPAQAADEPLTLDESWHLSSGNGLRLAIVLLTAPLLLNGLSLALRSVLSFDHIALVAARSLTFCALGVFEIASLSVSYRLLRVHPSNFDLQPEDGSA